MTKRSIGFPAHSTENEFAKTTRPDPTAAPYVNLLTKADSSQRPREQLVSNIIYVPTYEGWIYLSTVIDLFSCAVMGCDLSDFFCVSGTIEAIERTINQVGFIRSGCQYTSQAFRQTITTLGWRQSMSAKGYCYDNTFAESLASSAIFDYIEIFCNRHRRHSSLNMSSPIQVMKLYFSNQK